jgi:hypothetical protein
MIGPGTAASHNPIPVEVAEKPESDESLGAGCCDVRRRA